MKEDRLALTKAVESGDTDLGKLAPARCQANRLKGIVYFS